MSTKSDYTPEEWSQLTAGPMAAALYVITASPSLLGMFSEVNAMVRALQEAAAQTPAGTLQSAVLADLDQQTMKHQMNEMKPRGGADQAASMARLLEAVRAGGAVVGAKGTADDADAYRQLVLGVAQKVAEAAKDEGQAVGAREQTALDALRAALGAPA